MTGLLDKIRVLGLGVSHTVVDKAIDMNSIAVLEQRCRDLESSREASQAAVSRARFSYQSAQSNLDAHDKTAQSTADNIRLLSGANNGNPNEAQVAERTRLLKIYSGMKDGRPNEVANVDALKTQLAKMEDAVQTIIDEETKYKTRIAELRTMNVNAAALTSGAKAIKGATDAAAAMGGIDDVENKIREKSAVATDTFNNVIESVNGNQPHAEIDKMKQDDLLASILGGQAPAKQQAA